MRGCYYLHKRHSEPADDGCGGADVGLGGEMHGWGRWVGCLADGSWFHGAGWLVPWKDVDSAQVSGRRNHRETPPRQV